MAMTSTLLILLFGFGMMLISFGLLLGYLIFGRKREILNRTANETVVVERDGNLLGTAAAVAGGVIAGELIADAIEEAIDDNIGKEIEEGIEDAGESITDAIDDLTDDFGGF